MNQQYKFSKKSFKRFFKSNGNVILSTIFGSAQDGIINPGSDLDIAVLFCAPLKGVRFLDFYSRLSSIDRSIAKIDLVVLNNASPILAFEALNGEYLCKNHPQKAAEFFSLICREYEDTMSSIEYQNSLPKAK